MPVVIVYGVPKDTPTQKLLELMNDYTFIISDIWELKITGNQVSCFFPGDLIPERPDDEIIILVQGLYKMPEQAEEVLKEIAKSLGQRTKMRYFPNALVKCFIESIDPAACWSSTE